MSLAPVLVEEVRSLLQAVTHGMLGLRWYDITGNLYITDGKLDRLPPEGSAQGREGDRFASDIMCLLSGRCQGFDLVLVYGVGASSMEHLKDPFLATFRNRIKATSDVLHSTVLHSSANCWKVFASCEELGLDKGLGWVGFMFAQRRYRSTRSGDSCGVWIQEDVGYACVDILRFCWFHSNGARNCDRSREVDVERLCSAKQSLSQMWGGRNSGYHRPSFRYIEQRGGTEELDDTPQSQVYLVEKLKKKDTHWKKKNETTKKCVHNVGGVRLDGEVANAAKTNKKRWKGKV